MTVYGYTLTWWGLDPTVCRYTTGFMLSVFLPPSLLVKLFAHTLNKSPMVSVHQTLQCSCHTYWTTAMVPHKCICSQS